MIAKLLLGLFSGIAFGFVIQPVFFSQAPDAWLSSRPSPQDAYVHFHSTHDRRGRGVLRLLATDTQPRPGLITTWEDGSRTIARCIIG